jgi:hypothetical protein
MLIWSKVERYVCTYPEAKLHTRRPGPEKFFQKGSRYYDAMLPRLGYVVQVSLG